MRKIVASPAVIVLLGNPARAGTRTVILSVSGMTCAACPIAVRKALSKVPGMRKVEAAFEARGAVVTFDDDRTGIVAPTRAGRDAGFPATLEDRP